jgi:hypothetical protein
MIDETLMDRLYVKGAFDSDDYIGDDDIAKLWECAANDVKYLRGASSLESGPARLIEGLSEVKRHNLVMALVDVDFMLARHIGGRFDLGELIEAEIERRIPF